VEGILMPKKKREESALKESTLKNIEEELYEAAQEEFQEILKDKNCLEQFAEGYKAGFKDGFNSVVKEYFQNMKQMKFTDESGEEIQPGPRQGPWWP
jgi:flagellar biosynthesis/type III secretory pathway protein FliH